jgi:hypothetical protein
MTGTWEQFMDEHIEKAETFFHWRCVAEGDNFVESKIVLDDETGAVLVSRLERERVVHCVQH